MSFLTINSRLSPWADIFWLGRECFFDVDYDVNDQLILPSLSDIIKSYSKAKADQPNFEPGHSINFDGIIVNDALVPPPHYELLQDCQAVTPLQSQATSQAAPPPTLHPCDACCRGSGQRLYSRQDHDWVA
jgi:hypothetical protein